MLPEQPFDLQVAMPRVWHLEVVYYSNGVSRHLWVFMKNDKTRTQNGSTKKLGILPRSRDTASRRNGWARRNARPSQRGKREGTEVARSNVGGTYQGHRTACSYDPLLIVNTRIRN